MTSNIENHRIWKLIESAQDKGKDVMDFYRPVSKLADIKYEKLCRELNAAGYTTNDMTNPNGNSLTGIIRVGNLLINAPYYEADDGPLSAEQCEEIQRIADDRYFAQTGKHLPGADDPAWERLFDN